MFLNYTELRLDDVLNKFLDTWSLILEYDIFNKSVKNPRLFLKLPNPYITRRKIQNWIVTAVQIAPFSRCNDIWIRRT